jgi:Uma2 family endonuclease
MYQHELPRYLLPKYQDELPRYLPTAEELPNSDDTPVDNELQELIPSLLKSILRMLWKGRMDWFFGIHMGIYTHPEQPPIVPIANLKSGIVKLSPVFSPLTRFYSLCRSNGIGCN